ncbi:MAG: PAS domain S-box protein [Deltaproteobacteria bacterium]|nr:PAS domain S-box protein [Deltaproteobacteria bacterium]MBW2400099.1 PAS domain S-box protein [Deltaproteobacteria bacterium]
MAKKVQKATMASGDLLAVYQALDRVQAIIEFELDGTVVTANENFLGIFGYELDEVVGKHHRIFCDPGYVETPEYAAFWQKLGRGEYDAGEFKRLAKGGKEIWLQSSYNPVFDKDGEPIRVVKFATDVTAAKLETAEFQGKIHAIDRAQAVIEFELDGTVITANENFLATFGYSLDEISGKHHRIFCDPGYVETPEYVAFWQKLGRGEYDTGEFKRLAKGGKEIWLQASYNPIFDADGKPVKVVKFAADVTAAKLETAEFQGKVRAIERAQAVIEFELDGRVITANENFLHIFGYSLDEVVGKHHRIFCDPGYVETPEYAAFWQKLGRGEYEADEFKRISKNGAEIWLQASYNPIFDTEGRPLKIVKFAADITLEVQKRSLALLEMSTPVTKIWDGVLFAPIVGIVDSKRSVDIMNKALSSIADTRASTLLLDIGGVAVVDTAVANHLIKIAKAAVLMGCKTIISGISPSIAQTIAELGIDLGAIQTTSTIESALRDSITRTVAGSRVAGA